MTLRPTPITIQKLLNHLKDFDKVKKNLVEYKIAFCNAFENEVNCVGEVYSEDLFDYIYNVYENKKVFKTEEVFQYQVREFKSLDFNQQGEVQLYIAKEYQRMLFLGRDHFMQVLSLNHDDPAYIAIAVKRNPSKTREALRKLL